MLLAAWWWLVLFVSSLPLLLCGRGSTRNLSTSTGAVFWLVWQRINGRRPAWPFLSSKSSPLKEIGSQPGR